MSDAPIGLEPSNNGDSAPEQVQTPDPGQAPTPLELAEDTLIRLKGQEKPVKFGEHVKGFQSQFTRASQEAARLKRELEQERQTRQRYEQERQRQAGQQNGQPDVFDALAQLPYLSGKDAVEMVKQISSAVGQRDQVIIALAKKVQSMEQSLGGISENHSNQLFDAKISKWVQDGGYPPEAAELAKEVYLAYEGEDLDNEFPTIFANRWAQVEKMIEARKQAKIAAARKAPFVPGKGGQGTPSKPFEIKANASAREVADDLWPTWQGSGT